MKTPTKLWIVASVALFTMMTAAYLYQHSLAFVRAAPEDRNGLWMAALKGIGGTPSYMGSVGDYSYFRVDSIICSRYKAPTAKLHLPNTFPLGEGTPYRVTSKMVPPYP